MTPFTKTNLISSEHNINYQINGVIGLEGNLPAFCVLPDVQDPAFQVLHKETTGMHRYSSGLIINTFDLEVQCLPQFATFFWQNLHGRTS